MDKIQIYYIALISLRIIIVTISGAIKPNELAYPSHTNSDRAGLLPLDLLVIAPIVGRIFGWW